MKVWVSVFGFAMVLVFLNANVMAFSPSLDTVLVTQSPYPVEPGENVNIEIEIQNTGYIEASDIVVEIIVNDPFRLLPGEDVKKTFANIPGRGSVKTSYNLHVNESALTGDYEIEFNMYISTDPGTYTRGTVSVNIQGEAELILESLESLPSKIEPGVSASLIVKIKNIGTGSANKLNIKLNSTHEELIPVLAGGSAYVGNLAPNQIKTAELELSVSSLAEHKTYTLTLTAEYRDESNTATEKDFSVGIPVTGSILLEIIKIEPNYIRNTLKIEVANKGTTEAKSLEAKLIIGGETIDIDYISSLKANKKTTFDFPLVLQGSGQLLMNYIGPGIESNQVSEDVVLDLEAPSDGNGVTWFVTAVIIIIIIYFLYRKFFRKKK